jgi:hypothetical protein
LLKRLANFNVTEVIILVFSDGDQLVVLKRDELCYYNDWNPRFLTRHKKPERIQKIEMNYFFFVVTFIS